MFSLIFLCFLLPLNAFSQKVLDLSSYELDEFKSELENYDSLFIKFYAPYCSKCKVMANDFIQTADTVGNDDPPLALAEVDCTSGRGSEICSEFNVGSYPQLKLFKQGEFHKNYEGTKDSDAMIEWLRKSTKLASRRYSSFSELNKKVQDASEPVVIGIFNDNDEPLLEQYQRAARKVKNHWNYRDLIFVHIFEDYSTGSSSQLTSIGLNERKVLRAPALVIHRPPWLQNKKEATDVVYDVSSKEDLVEWIYRKAFGIIIWRTRDNEEQLKPPLVVAYYAVDFKRNPTFTHFWRNRMINSAKKHPDLNFAISSSHTFRKILRRQNLEPPKDGDDPLVVTYDIFGVMYVMRDKFTVSNFENYIQDFKKGEVMPHLKSMEPANDNDERDVKIVTGATFHIYVTNSEKDVFIMFYAPWCRHSQELEPTWDELGRQMRQEPHIEIAKIDAVGNEVPSQFEVPSYPTLYLVPSKTKKPMKYLGGRYIHEFVLFLAANSTVEMVEFTRDGTRRSAGNSSASAIKTEL